MSTSERSDDVVIRPAVRSELEALAAFLTPFVDEEKLLPRTMCELDDLVPTGFVAEQQGTIVGFAALEIYSGKLAEVRSLAVSQTLQGRGIGKRLVRACVERARQENVLEVMAITSSENFFRSCGFDFTLPGEKKALFWQP